ncbi:MAG: fluoride efflux transporter CrcB [Acidimicrobiia bacterium]|nr:fluoride efflux transporter CrcB [Acidimicrobiia bacterium]
MRIVLFVAIGGAIGAVGRYLLSTPINERAAPWGTILVNLIGSALLGFLIGWFSDRSADPAIQIGLLTGVLGGFTTFSTFSAETMLLLDGGRWRPAILNVVVSVVFGIAAAAVGYSLARA